MKSFYERPILTVVSFDFDVIVTSLGVGKDPFDDGYEDSNIKG